MALGTAPDGHLAVPVPQSRRAVRLDVALVHRCGSIFSLHRHVGVGESLGEIALLQHEVIGDVRALFVVVCGEKPSGLDARQRKGLQTFVQQRRVVIHCLHNVRHFRKDLVFDVNSRKRFLGKVWTVGSHGGHGMTLVQRLLRRQHVVAQKLRVRHRALRPGPPFRPRVVESPRL